jgi:class 3 adenylate cyclase
LAVQPKPGSLLGRFRIKCKMSTGDTGVLYRAEDTLLKVPIALKIFSPAMAEDEMYKAISREILLTRRLNHPGICTIHDLHEEKGLRFVTMDYIQGQTLQTLIDRYKEGLSVPDAVKIVGGVGEAVAVAHQQKIAHRNLKPSNIVIGDDDRVIVLEFGHARAPDMGGKTVANVRQDDLAYAAPEVLFNQPASEVSDVFSLGAILYTCVTGQTPLETSGPVKASTGFRGSKPALPSKLNRQVTSALEQVIMTAISANPETRYRNAGEFTAELLDTVEDLSARSRRPRRRLADELGPDPEATAETEAITDNMERITLLFSDIVAITSFFETHGDIAGRKRIERHNELLFPIVRKLGGSVLKTIGDAIMASFPDEDDAVDAAIQMQQVLERYSEGVADEVDQIRIRIGINTGETIVEYGDAYGDAVNVAARVCSKADGEQILLSEDTCRALTRNRDIVNPHSVVTLKGKRDKFQLFQVDWLLADDLKPLAGDLKPLAGELEALADEPPDLSYSDNERTYDGDGEATAVVESTVVTDSASEAGVLDKAVDLASAAHRIRKGPSSLLDRFCEALGMQRNSKTTFGLVLVVVILLLTLFGGVYLMCGDAGITVDPR